MTTILDIANRGLRRMGVLGKGQVATAQLGEDALEAWQGLVDDLPGLRKGPWTGVLIEDASDYDASDGERINTLGFNPTITLPDTYEDENGATVPTLDLSRVQIIGGDQEGLWVFSASTGAWAQVDGLALSDDSPFGPEDTTGLAAMLAVEMAPDFGETVTLSNVVVERASRQQRSFRARFRRAISVPVDDVLTIMSDIGNPGMADLTS